MNKSLIQNRSHMLLETLKFMNANKYAEDYQLVNLNCNKEDTLRARLAKGGGFVAILQKK